MYVECFSVPIYDTRGSKEHVHHRATLEEPCKDGLRMTFIRSESEIIGLHSRYFEMTMNGCAPGSANSRFFSPLNIIII